MPLPETLSKVWLRAVTEGNRQGKSSEQGVTLLECLMAIIVIGLTVAMTTPPLFVAAATRVQNRRAEQALQIAQGEVDRVQTLVQRGQHTPARLPVNAGPAINATAPINLNTVGAPTAIAPELRSVNPARNTYTGRQLNLTEALPIDIDGDGEADYLMQVFIGNIRRAPSQTNYATFQTGVRVYSVLARNNLGSLQTQQASLQLTSGQGSQRLRPLAVLYPNVAWSDRSFSLCEYHRQDAARQQCR